MYSNTINNGYYSWGPSILYPNTIQLNVSIEVSSLAQAPVPDFSAIPHITKDTRISLADTFGGNRSLRSIDFTNWTHKTIVDLSDTFNGCLNLQSIKGFSSLDLSSCDRYNNMCRDCQALREIDLSNRAIKTSGWELRLTDAFTNCPVLHTAIITSRTPRFAFPPHTTIIDLTSGVNRIFTDRITALEQQLSSKDQQLSTLRTELDALRQELSTVLARLPGLSI